MKFRYSDFYMKLALSGTTLAISLFYLPLFHIPNMFSYFWLVVYKLGFGDVEALSYRT